MTTMPLPLPGDDPTPTPPTEPHPRDTSYVDSVHRLGEYLNCPEASKEIRWGYGRTLTGELVRVTMFAPHDVPEPLAEVLVAEFGSHVCPTDNPLGVAYAIRTDAPPDHVEIIGSTPLPDGFPDRPRMPGDSQVTRLEVICGCGEVRKLRRGPWRSAMRKLWTIHSIYAGLAPALIRRQLHTLTTSLRDNEPPADSVSDFFNSHGPPALADLVARGQTVLRRNDGTKEELAETYRLALPVDLADLDPEACPVLDAGDIPDVVGEEEILSRLLLWSMTLRARALQE